MSIIIGSNWGQEICCLMRSDSLPTPRSTIFCSSALKGEPPLACSADFNIMPFNWPVILSTSFCACMTSNS